MARSSDLTRRRAPDRGLLVLIALALAFSMGHHADHIIRGNHVGWPLTTEPTPFTYSFGFYPLILGGLWFYVRGRLGPLFWALLALLGLLFVGLLHFGPVAVEPPGDVMGPYRARNTEWAGYAALAWLVGFLLTLGVTAAYAARMWARQRQRTGGGLTRR